MRALTPKQESFCQRYLETGNASEAYRLCYSAEKAKPETVNRSAKELLDNPKIAARLSELRAEALVDHSVTIASLLKELEQARLVAMKKRQGAAMVQATMGKAKLAGLEKGPEPGDTPTPASVRIEIVSGRKNANSQ
ncbi:terminase small subunit [Stenotrophomonas geniculata]|uniref:terminase small subunit n=1 Tax=Stenotrophomonas geniculata TaxID=86188 RepID=UPI00247A3E86|nr:terminase small subunit [Stenotrophomonas geniculata]MDH7548255.1 terminase small subunit [Stenotrophomonas geniculata]